MIKKDAKQFELYYNNKMLENAANLGTKQYLNFSNNTELLDYFKPNISHQLTTLEIDSKTNQEDKLNKLTRLKIKLPDNLYWLAVDMVNFNDFSKITSDPHFDKTQKTYCNLLGLTRNLTKRKLTTLFKELDKILSPGSTLVFDYVNSGNQNNSGFTYFDIEQSLAQTDFLIYEHLDSTQLSTNIFNEENSVKQKLLVSQNINYCLAVKRY